jgi:hypothetical protein
VNHGTQARKEVEQLNQKLRDVQVSLEKSETKVNVLTTFLETMMTPQQIEKALSKLGVSAKLPKDATLKDIVDLLTEGED